MKASPDVRQSQHLMMSRNANPLNPTSPAKHTNRPPRSRAKASIRTRKHPETRIFQNRPPYRFLKLKEPRQIFDEVSFAETHRWGDDRIKTYLEIDRVGGKRLAAAICAELETSRIRRFAPADLLYANNVESRIDVLAITLDHALRQILVDKTTPAFFVTMTPDRFGTTFEDAASFDVRRIQAWVRQMLPGFDFLGIVEPAFFPRGRNQTERGAMISWHVHLLIWGTAYGRLNRVLRRIRRTELSFVAGTPSTDCRTLKTRRVLAGKITYMLKSPQKQYRVLRDPRKPVVDLATGEIVAKPNVMKNWLQTGQRVLMCRVLAGRYVDELLFGQGGGTMLRRAIVAEALRQFEADKRTVDRRSVRRLPTN